TSQQVAAEFQGLPCNQFRAHFSGFVFHRRADLRGLHSFPTRRSSDLAAGGLDYAAVSAAVKRFERRFKKEKAIGQLVKQASAKRSKERMSGLQPHRYPVNRCLPV